MKIVSSKNNNNNNNNGQLVSSSSSSKQRTRIAVAACAAALASSSSPSSFFFAGAFVTPSRSCFRTTQMAPTISILSPTSLVASTLDNPTVATNSTSVAAPYGNNNNNNNLQSNTAASIVNNAPRTTLDVRIHGTWYDLTGMLNIINTIPGRVPDSTRPSHRKRNEMRRRRLPYPER